MKYEGVPDDQIQHGKNILTAALGVGLLLILLEFVFYFIIYRSLEEQNKSFINIVQEDALKARARKNTITFTGQAIAFIVEVNYGMVMQLLIHFGPIGGFFEPAAIPCASIVNMAAVTSAHILSSPELRRFILRKD